MGSTIFILFSLIYPTLFSWIMSGKYILIVHTCIFTLILFPYPWRHQIDNGTVFHCIWTVLESNYLTNLLREILSYVLLLLFGRCYDFQDTLHARKDTFVSSFLNFSIWVLLQFNFVQYWKNKVSGNSFVLSVFWGLILRESGSIMNRYLILTWLVSTHFIKRSRIQREKSPQWESSFPVLRKSKTKGTYEYTYLWGNGERYSTLSTNSVLNQRGSKVSVNPKQKFPRIITLRQVGRVVSKSWNNCLHFPVILFLVLLKAMI